MNEAVMGRTRLGEIGVLDIEMLCNVPLGFWEYSTTRGAQVCLTWQNP